MRIEASARPASAGVREQRSRALAHANRIRVARKDMKGGLRCGTVQIADVLADPPDWLLTAPVREVLLATPTIGTVRTKRLLGRARIGFGVRVGALTARQLAALLALV
jgi:hypothetical protein